MAWTWGDLAKIVRGARGLMKLRWAGRLCSFSQVSSTAVQPRRESAMWVRVSRFEGGSPEQFEQGMRYIEEHVLPPMRQMRGWKGVLSLSPADRSTGLTLTFWESEEALRESEEAANRLRGEAAEAGGGTVAGVERYEVVFNEAPLGA